MGDSLAVNGVCLTLIEKKGDLLRFNLAAPTLRLSNLGDLPVGSLLNIEFPLAADGLLGGHMVSGHIDGTVRVRSVNKSAAELALAFFFPGPRMEKVPDPARLGGPERRQPDRLRDLRFLVRGGDHPADPGHPPISPCCASASASTSSSI